MQSIYAQIKKDRQIWKFCFYGFFKNLRFFEPFLYFFFLKIGLSYLEIGTLLSIREITVYILEVPTGVFADTYGRKKSLLISFTLYALSFTLFFFSRNFYLPAIGMILYGGGEAFRSGSHKAMIYTYLEHKGWFKYKTFVYGRTRSFSLLGSAISSIFSAFIVILVKDLKYMFLISIFPYVADFFLILSYPNWLDQAQEKKFNIKVFLKNFQLKTFSTFKNRKIVFLLIASSLYEAVFKTVKDYIQPMLKILISFERNAKVISGLVYGLFNISGSFASRNAYKLLKFRTSTQLVNYTLDLLGINLLLIAVGMEFKILPLVILAFFLIYLIKDARKPFIVDLYGEYTNKHERATVLSIDNQIRAFLIIFLAPFLGLLADKLSLSYAFGIIGLLILLLNFSILKRS